MAGHDIRVCVSGKGVLKRFVADEEAVLPCGATVSHLVSRLNLPEGFPVVCLKEGRRILPSAPLHDGDRIIMIAILPGG